MTLYWWLTVSFLFSPIAPLIEIWISFSLVQMLSLSFPMSIDTTLNTIRESSFKSWQLPRISWLKTFQWNIIKIPYTWWKTLRFGTYGVKYVKHCHEEEQIT
jgi:hypothetical protein